MKKIISLTTSVFLFLLTFTTVHAQDISISVQRPSNLKIGDFGKLLSGTIGVVLIIAALSAFIYLLWGGLQWITSGGDKAAVETAQHRIQAALLGLFIVFAAYAIMLVVGQFFGFDFANLKFPTPF
ncbi:hypothetical protein A2960_06300 [Candidatus Gottesmanbacteria bacterium RIFCSPLOWO2_01_FULL_39_12b]|uniref:DUF5671 domain-containing protein n=1 Tax=Candidatus Gottesmanbacteria bacterium RIFCSPLOWO2_01_FULL_39_12b TaxID=1798388 RepID=A0A1F6AP32_9BACT|nr:MAG: hypothetical protein A2960_06300 [Candidatus Gottesmanbacteria bacterium RIFCSPLOWO2_01_FULL_39_12b]